MNIAGQRSTGFSTFAARGRNLQSDHAMANVALQNPIQTAPAVSLPSQMNYFPGYPGNYPPSGSLDWGVGG